MKDRLSLKKYPFTLRPLTEEEGGGYLVEYTDIAGCIADGETPQEAIQNGLEALEATIVTLKELSVPVPAPGSASAASGQWRQRVPKSLHARLVERARKEGVSLNTLVTAMIAEGLGVRRQS